MATLIAKYESREDIIAIDIQMYDEHTIDCIRTLLEKNAEVTNQDLQLVQESHHLMLFDLFEEFGYDLSAPITVDTV